MEQLNDVMNEIFGAIDSMHIREEEYIDFDVVATSEVSDDFYLHFKTDGSVEELKYDDETGLFKIINNDKSNRMPELLELAIRKIHLPVVMHKDNYYTTFGGEYYMINIDYTSTSHNVYKVDIDIIDFVVSELLGTAYEFIGYDII